MAAHHALEIGAYGVGLADVERDPCRAALAGEAGDPEDLAVAADDGRQAVFVDRLVGMVAGDGVAGLRSQELASALERRGGVARVDRFREGRVDPLQPSVRRAEPGRHRERVDQAQHRLVLRKEPLVLEPQPCEPALGLGERQEPDDGEGGRPAALDLERRAGLRFDDDVEAQRLLAELGDRALERGGRLRHHPAAEGEEGSALLGRAGSRRQRSDEVRLVGAVCPRDDPLVAQVQERVRALQRGAEFGDPRTQCEVLGCGAGALADQPDRREQGRPHDAGKHRELDDFGGADRDVAEQGSGHRFPGARLRDTECGQGRAGGAGHRRCAPHRPRAQSPGIVIAAGFVRPAPG